MDQLRVRLAPLNVPWTVLSATLSDAMLQTVKKKLGLRDPLKVVRPPGHRPELLISVLPVTAGVKPLAREVAWLLKNEFEDGDVGLLYAP